MIRGESKTTYDLQDSDHDDDDGGSDDDDGRSLDDDAVDHQAVG